jgi:mRNA interferase MazF
MGRKKRPAVVVSSGAYDLHRPDVILMAVTSQVRQTPGFGEVLIKDWRAAGLSSPQY